MSSAAECLQSLVYTYSVGNKDFSIIPYCSTGSLFCFVACVLGSVDFFCNLWYYAFSKLNISHKLHSIKQAHNGPIFPALSSQPGQPERWGNACCVFPHPSLHECQSHLLHFAEVGPVFVPPRCSILKLCWLLLTTVNHCWPLLAMTYMVSLLLFLHFEWFNCRILISKLFSESLLIRCFLTNLTLKNG